jgi:hypothetical protein
MNKTVIVVKDDVIDVVIKNFCSFSYNKLTHQFTFVSTLINTNVVNVSSYYKFKSFGFRYGGEREITEQPFEFKCKPEFVFVIHKSFNNGYNIKKGVHGSQFENFTYLTVPSKIFKKLRYAMYELNNARSYNPIVVFRYKKITHALIFENLTKKLIFRKILISGNCDVPVKDYICFDNYTVLILENEEEYIFSSLFRKHRTCKNKHFINYPRDLSLRFDIFEYTLSKPELLELSEPSESKTEGFEF